MLGWMPLNIQQNKCAKFERHTVIELQIRAILTEGGEVSNGGRPEVRGPAHTKAWRAHTAWCIDCNGCLEAVLTLAKGNCIHDNKME